MACTPFSEQVTVCEYVGQSSTSLCVQRCKVNIAMDLLEQPYFFRFSARKRGGTRGALNQVTPSRMRSLTKPGSVDASQDSICDP